MSHSCNVWTVPNNTTKIHSDLTVARLVFTILKELKKTARGWPAICSSILFCEIKRVWQLAYRMSLSLWPIMCVVRIRRPHPSCMPIPSCCWKTLSLLRKCHRGWTVEIIEYSVLRLWSILLSYIVGFIAAMCLMHWTHTCYYSSVNNIITILFTNAFVTTCIYVF